MKFNVVIGNPPYNRGADLDFIELGHKISSVCSMMITPAKWQTAEDSHVVSSIYSTYASMRKNVVPYMKKVVFYPDCTDVFAIRNVDGVSYYLAVKEKQTRTLVKNINSHQKYFNCETHRSILNRNTLVNVGQTIIDYLLPYNKYEFEPIHKDKKYGVYMGSQINCGNGWGYTDRDDPCGLISRDGDFYVLGLADIVDIQDPIDSIRERGAETLIFTSNSIEECNNYVAWLNTKFVRFFIAINISKLNNIMTDDYFRFVPAPFIKDNKYDWNIKYTDEMLYKHFELTNEQINIIEAIVKKRQE